MAWLHKLELDPIHHEILDEYLITHDSMSNPLTLLERRIEEMASESGYREQKLICFLWMSTYSARSILVETGDFSRFKSAAHYACYLGLTPREYSSGTIIKQEGITKPGNSQARLTLVISPRP